jgi:transcriptional regulator with XRE-family HTH domain
MNLKAARLNRGLSTRAAADEIGVTQAILMRAEDGLGVRPAHAKQIADYYGCRVTDIWPVDDDESIEAVA